jgi:hypothetical protein
VFSRRGESSRSGGTVLSNFSVDYDCNHPRFFSIWQIGDVYDTCEVVNGRDKYFLLKSDIDNYFYQTIQRNGEEVPNHDQRVAVGQERPVLSTAPVVTLVNTVLFFQSPISGNTIEATALTGGIHKFTLTPDDPAVEGAELLERIGKEIANNAQVSFEGWQTSAMNRTYTIRFFAPTLNASQELVKLEIIVDDDGSEFQDEAPVPGTGLTVSMFVPDAPIAATRYGVSLVRDFGENLDESGLTFTDDIPAPLVVGSLHKAHAPWCFGAYYNAGTVDADFGSNDFALTGTGYNGATAGSFAFTTPAALSGGYLDLPNNAYVEYTDTINSYVAEELLLHLRQVITSLATGTNTGELVTIFDGTSDAAKVSLACTTIGGGASATYNWTLGIFNDFGERRVIVSLPGGTIGSTPSDTAPHYFDLFARVKIGNPSQVDIYALINGVTPIAPVITDNTAFSDNRTPVNHKVVVGCVSIAGNVFSQKVGFLQIGNNLGAVNRVKLTVPDQPAESTNTFTVLQTVASDSVTAVTQDGHTTRWGIYKLDEGDFKLLDYAAAVSIAETKNTNTIKTNGYSWGIEGSPSALLAQRSLNGASEYGIKYGTVISILSAPSADALMVRYIGERGVLLDPIPLVLPSVNDIFQEHTIEFKDIPVSLMEVESVFKFDGVSLYSLNHEYWELCQSDYGTTFYDSGNRVLSGNPTTYFQSADTGDIINYGPPPELDLIGDKPFQGILFGASGTRVYWTIQNNFNAWPEQFFYDFEETVKGIIAGGTELFVLTTDSVYLSRPNSAFFVDFIQVATEGCLSKHAYDRHRDGVIFVSANGLRFVGGGGAFEAIAEQVMPREWFQALQQRLRLADDITYDMNSELLTLAVRGDVVYMMTKFGEGLRYDLVRQTLSYTSSVSGMLTTGAGSYDEFVSSKTQIPWKYQKGEGGVLTLLYRGQEGYPVVGAFGYQSMNLALSVIEDYPLTTLENHVYAVNILSGRIQGAPPDYKWYQSFELRGNGQNKFFATLVAKDGIICGGSTHINSAWTNSHIKRYDNAGVPNIWVANNAVYGFTKGAQIKYGDEVMRSSYIIGAYTNPITRYSAASSAWVTVSTNVISVARYMGRYKMTNTDGSLPATIEPFTGPPPDFVTGNPSNYFIERVQNSLFEYIAPFGYRRYDFAESWCGPIFDVVDNQGNLTHFNHNARIYVPVGNGATVDTPWVGPYSGCIFHGMFPNGAPYWLQIFDSTLSFLNDTGAGAYFSLSQVWPKMKRIAVSAPWVLPVPDDTTYARWVFPEPGIELDMDNEKLSTIWAPNNLRYEYLYYCVSMRQELEILSSGADFVDPPVNEPLGEIRGIRLKQ